jgi:hypothetical protein
MISVISIDETEKWNNIVKSFKNYDVNYLCEYAKAFQLQEEGEPILFYYDDGNCKAMNVVVKRDIAKAEQFINELPLNIWFDLSTPYGYGGFWFEGEGYEKVMNAYNAYCRDQGFVSEFVRFHLFSDYCNLYDGIVETHTHNVVRSLDLSLDEMLLDFEHKVRKNIVKATNAGLEVKVDYTGEKLDDFLRIYYRTMDRTNAKKNFFFTKEFFMMLNQMKDNFAYVHVLYEGEVISTELVLYGTENCYSFLGGTNSDFFHLRPNDLLKYEIIKWAKKTGLNRFVLGGGYGSDDGIFKYKKSFAPNGVYDFYLGKKIFNKEKYDLLVEMRKSNGKNIVSNTFFPEYRADFE